MRLLPVSEVLCGTVENEGGCAPNCAHPFWGHVKVGEPTECWPFLGGKDKDGYGQYYLNGQKWRAHRFSLVLSMGSAAMDLHALHECDTPACCNPAHLKPGTHQKNMEERDARGRQAKGESNGRAKLTAETVRAIRAAYVPHKVSKRTLAARFGVNYYIVRDIIDRVTWRGVEPVKEVA